jgi:predicted nucleotidyltransferase
MVLPAYDEMSKMRIYFIFSTTKYEREAITRANIINIDNLEIAFCSLEDLIILKLFAGRAIDIEDVKSIIRKNPNYNYQLVYNTLKDLGDATDTDLLQRLSELDKRN